MTDRFDIGEQIAELFRAKLQEFVIFCATTWTTTPEEAETLTVPTEAPEVYARGYNDAMRDGLQGALDHWLDEEGYGR